jgi:1-deoxy-D-xylulose-5-phosphate reductoisomerase
VYNAPNEECVAAFLAGRIGFLDIVDTVERGSSDDARRARGRPTWQECSPRTRGRASAPGTAVGAGR